ncbi:hypothetical protein INR49_007108 [Caranx melampygus]|nr:hypothetical protein INR49_007108 [Caranx melampygus]
MVSLEVSCDLREIRLDDGGMKRGGILHRGITYGTYPGHIPRMSQTQFPTRLCPYHHLSSIVFTMKMLALSLLLWAVMVLTRATDTDLVMMDLIKRTSTCPHGWKNINGRCFCFVSNEMSWPRAEKNCQTMGANLASVHNKDQYNKIQEMVRIMSGGFPHTWLGGSDAQETGLWLWSDGSSFNYKHCGTFDNYFWREHCLQMNYGDHKCWDDVNCGKYRPSVCAKKCK